MTKIDPSYLVRLYNDPIYLIPDRKSVSATPRHEALKTEVTDDVEDGADMIDLLPVVVITPKPDERAYNLLLNILRSVDLSFDHVSVIAPDQVPTSFPANVRVILDFAALEVTYKVEQKVTYKWLSADPLHKLDQDKQLKLKLWEQLKILFPK